MNWRYKIQRFMMGRYGPDELYRFLLILYVLLFIVECFFPSRILNTTELLIVLFMFYRFFSKNISRRKKENKKYLQIKKCVVKPFLNIKRNWQERDYFVYKKCHKCKSTLKLPLPPKRGIQHVKCPTCKNRVSFICLRQEKIEVIKGKRGIK